MAQSFGGSVLPDYAQRGFGSSANDPVAAFLHWAIHGRRPGSGLDALPGQVASMFNPTTRAGAANLASMFAGGPKGDFVTPEGELLPNPGMPGKYEPYSPAKAAAGGHLGQDQVPYEVHDALRALRSLHERQQNPQGIDRMPHMQRDIAQRIEAMTRLIHDHLFGGEVHAKGPIPKQADMRAIGRQYRAAKAQLAKLPKSSFDAEAALQRARMHNRRAMDEKLGSAPMQAHPRHPQEEHDAALIHGPSVIRHPSFIKGLLKRQFQTPFNHHRN